MDAKESLKPRPSSVEPPKTETTLLDDSEHKPEFKAYWHKAHRILRAFPRAKAKADGKIPSQSPTLLVYNLVFLDRYQ